MMALLNRGQMLNALQASAAFWFTVVALALGLATALFSIRDNKPSGDDGFVSWN
jgi:hypothetical protein